MTRSLLAIQVFMLSLAFLQAQTTPDVVTRSTRAVGYQVGGGESKIAFKGTELLPQATGEAKVEVQKGYTEIEAEFKQLVQPTKFGAEFLTYVLWAVSPDGRSSNLGEVQIDKEGKGKLKVSSQMQTFSLLVTAEPFFAVRLPSELLVLENEVLKNTKGKIFPIDHYSLMKKSRYQKLDNPLALTLDLKAQPLELYEARNAVAIAKSNASDQYAEEIYKKAEASLQMAENALKSKAPTKQVISTSRQAVQFSQDALTLSVERQEAERLANEKKAREDAERLAQDQARQETERRAQAEAGKARAEAERARADAERARAEAAQAQALLQSQEAQRKAEYEASLRAKSDAERQEAERLAKQAEAEKMQLRARLLEQFSKVLDTRDTERGLVVNMSDVLFDTGKYTLRPEAREKLARIAGIVINYPQLRLESEGHTDNVGSVEFNQKLSEQRADSVRQYLITQGVPVVSITAVGKAFSMPVASNDTVSGRQQNRRVELIVSGEIIGTTIGATRQ